MDLCPLHPRFYKTDKTPCPECSRLAALEAEKAQPEADASRSGYSLGYDAAAKSHREFHNRIARQNVEKLAKLRERCATLQARACIMTVLALTGWATVIGLCIKDYLK